MTNFTRGDLRFNYSWKTTEGDSRKVIGFPDNAELNRHEGYEVLHFINKYMTSYNYASIYTFQKIERAIHEELPGTIRSHEKVKTWINTNYRLANKF